MVDGVFLLRFTRDHEHVVGQLCGKFAVKIGAKYCAAHIFLWQIGMLIPAAYAMNGIHRWEAYNVVEFQTIQSAYFALFCLLFGLTHEPTEYLEFYEQQKLQKLESQTPGASLVYEVTYLVERSRLILSDSPGIM